LTRQTFVVNALAMISPIDPNPGWLKRFAERLLAARASGTVTSSSRIEMVWLLQLGYMLATEINTGLKPHRGSVLGIVKRQGISNQRTERAALQDIVTRLQQTCPQYAPSPGFARALGQSHETCLVSAYSTSRTVTASEQP
jgi:hypothetical protein